MKVHISQIEFEPWAATDEVGATYKGKPFTGISFGEENDVHYERNYKDGRAHGKWTEKNQTTQEIILEGLYNNGAKVGIHKEIRPPFEMVTTFDHHLIRREVRKNGVLILNYDEKANIDQEYYDDGTLYSDTKVIKGRMYGSYYLGSEKNWLSKNVGFKYPDDKDKVLYNKSLFFNEIDALDSLFHRHIIERFCEFLLDTNEKEACSFFEKIIQHKDPFIKNTGIYYVGKSGNPGFVPALEKIVVEEKGGNKMTLDSRFSKLFDFSSITYPKTSSLAKKAIKKIITNNGGCYTT